MTLAGEVEAVLPHELYGGAIRVSFPGRFTDVSDFRPVPDHQEVWADANEDQSLVVEIVEHDASISDSDAARHYWADLATNNESTESPLQFVVALGPADIPHLPPDRVHYACLLTGTQIVSKGRQSQDKANHISVTLAVLRLPTVRSDVLITLNSPVVISTTSQAAESAGAGFKQRHLYAGTLMRQILGSLTVVDWGLFGQ